MNGCEHLDWRPALLPGGLGTAPVAVLRGMWLLQERGARFRMDDDGIVQVDTGGRAYDDDAAWFVSQYNDVLARILASESARVM